MLILPVSTLVLGLAVVACAQSNRPAEGPVGHTQTTSGTLTNPSYGASDDGWTDPAASGYATHGSATMGATARPGTETRADGGA